MTQRVPAEGGPVGENLPEPCEWLDRYGDSLYHYALSRLGRSHDAEDVVQETLLSALTRRGDFQGRSLPRTWLMGILKHKVVDRMRAVARHARGTDPDNLDAWFDSKGKWRNEPPRWDDPAAAVERWSSGTSCGGVWRCCPRGWPALSRCGRWTTAMQPKCAENCPFRPLIFGCCCIGPGCVWFIVWIGTGSALRGSDVQLPPHDAIDFGWVGPPPLLAGTSRPAIASARLPPVLALQPCGSLAP